MSIGIRIREKRNELNMSVDELAKKLNKNRATVYRYEKGDIENMPIDVIEPLARALNTTPQFLMGWDKQDLSGIWIGEGKQGSAYFSIDDKYVSHIEKWHREFGLEMFTDEEHKKLVEYGKFLISLRKG